MSMIQLAMQNFKSNLRNYLAVVLSMAFTILAFVNFQNIIYSNLFEGLGGKNAEYIDILVQIISIVLICFMFCFLWYATNVFLTKQKKEIGIYIFMGLTNQQIGKLYFIETVMTGIFAWILGISSGMLTTQLFQMILLAISDITVEIAFQFHIEPLILPSIVYLLFYLIFSIKGYVEIVRSSVLELVSATRQNEYVRQNPVVLTVKTILGLIILFSGYFLAIKEGGQEVMGNVLAAVALVILGVYLLFGGFLPMLFQKLAKRKTFLYQKERTLWVNNVIFRMKKNYRAYAMTCVLMLCSVTALATGFAMKYRYEAMTHFRTTYTYQIIGSQSGLSDMIRPLIEKNNQIEYETEITVLHIDDSAWKTETHTSDYAVVSYSQMKQLAKAAGLEFTLKNPKQDEIIKISRLYLLSLLTNRSDVICTIHGKTYQQIQETTVPYLGYLQEMMSLYLVNDKEYKRLLPLGEELYLYNYKIQDLSNFAAANDALDSLSPEMGVIKTDPNSSDIEWVKVLYTMCIFMFLVFILASGSILFMKLYNDSFEEKERMQTLRKIGISGKILKKSVSNELKAAYGLPFLVMAVSAYFSVHALEKMMYADLRLIYFASIAVVFAVFFCFSRLSAMAAAKE